MDHVGRGGGEWRQWPDAIAVRDQLDGEHVLIVVGGAGDPPEGYRHWQFSLMPTAMTSVKGRGFAY